VDEQYTFKLIYDKNGFGCGSNGWGSPCDEDGYGGRTGWRDVRGVKGLATLGLIGGGTAVGGGTIGFVTKLSKFTRAEFSPRKL